MVDDLILSPSRASDWVRQLATSTLVPMTSGAAFEGRLP